MTGLYYLSSGVSSPTSFFGCDVSVKTLFPLSLNGRFPYRPVTVNVRVKLKFSYKRIPIVSHGFFLAFCILERADSHLRYHEYLLRATE